MIQPFTLQEDKHMSLIISLVEIIHSRYRQVQVHHNAGNQYTTGVTNAGASTGVIKFAVPFSAPNTLYYVCEKSFKYGWNYYYLSFNLNPINKKKTLKNGSDNN